MYCPSCQIGLDHSEINRRKCNNCLHEWEIFHVHPINDLQKHSLSHLCKCNPEIEVENGNLIIVHNSYDGRDGVELENEILKT